MVSVKFIFNVYCVLCLFFGKKNYITQIQQKLQRWREEQLHFINSEKGNR